MHTKRFTNSIAAAGALLFSLTALANPLSVKAVEAKTAIAARPGETTRAAILAGASSAFIVGDPIGQVHSGADCSEVADREWSELIAQRVALDVPRVFSEQLARANYAAAAGQGEGKPLEVSAFVNDMALKVCQVGQGNWQGGVYVQMSWQVFSPESGRVLYQASTEGSYVLSDPRRASAAAGFREALAVSVRNLLADARFATMLQPRDADGRVAGTGRWY